MSQLHYTVKNKKGQHLNYEERQKIEILLKAGHKPKEIGELIGGRSERTIEREISRGKVELLNSDYTTRTEYSADIAQQKHDYNGTAKGPTLKIGSNWKLIKFIEDKIIKEKFSLSAALAAARAAGLKVNFCEKTLYNYIDMGIFPNLTNNDLPVKKEGKKRGYHHVRAAINQKGKSIEERPIEADNKEEYGHWELDTVVGKQGTKEVLMMLTERLKGNEIVRKINSKSQDCIVAELDKIERKIGSKRFREIFKTITCDNGCENLDFERMEMSVLTKQKRTQIYYAHPFSAWERGANECANKLIRRFIPKGADIGTFPKSFIKYIQHWINNYPRKRFNWLSSNQASLSLNLPELFW